MRPARFLLCVGLLVCAGSKLVWRGWENQEYSARSEIYLPCFWSFGKKVDPVLRENQALLEEALAHPAQVPVRDSLPWPVPDSVNIVLLTVESFRADVVDPVATPFLDSLRRHAISLDRHVSSANGTTYAIFSLVTGQWPNHYADWIRKPSPDAFQRRFPNSRRITGNAVSWSFWNQDKDLFGGWTDISSKVSSSPRHPDSTFLDSLLQELGHCGKRRFVALAMLNGTHYNYAVDSSDVVERKYSTDRFDFRNLDARQVGMIRARYRNSAHLVDRTLRRFFRGLDSTGLSRKTLVAITGDHGEEFMEYGFLTHTMLPDPPETRVPFLVAWKGWNFRIGGWTSHVDAVDLLAGIVAAPSDQDARKWAQGRTYPAALAWNMIPVPANADVFGYFDDKEWVMGQCSPKGLHLHREKPDAPLGRDVAAQIAALLQRP